MLVLQVDFTGFQRLQVDAGGMLGGVAHRLADVGHGDVGMVGSRRPGMTRHVGGEIGLQTQHPGDLVQVLVVAADGRVVLTVGLTDIGAGEHGEEIGAVGGGIFLDEIAHFRLNSHLDMLARLPPFIDDGGPLDVGGFQVGEVDKRHALGTEAEDEGVAGKYQFTTHAGERLLRGLVTQGYQAGGDVEGADAPDEVGLDGPLLSVGDVRGDGGEGRRVGD